MTANKDITFHEAYEEFIRSCKIKNLSEDTILYYNRCKKKFCGCFDETEKCSEIDADTYDDVIEYLQNKDDPPLSDETIKTNLRGIKAILNFCMDRGYVQKFKMKLIKTDELVKETYTDEELDILLKKPDIKKCSFAEYRTWVLANFALGTGLRISSMLNIQISDISLEEREVIIRRTKGRKQQIVPLSPYLCKILGEYLLYRGNSDNEAFLFPNQFGGKLSRSGANDSVTDYNRARGVEKTSIHLYRHTFAKKWIMNGGDIFSLQKILGHSSLEMVKKYVALFGGDLQVQYNRFNPLESFKQETEQKVLKMKRKY